ncbi:hypothetical protein BMW23_0494 [Bodo saltans virus]|jgi:hypothetical protein|uniref:Uncharacterized protein n=1 Tax=Bodo saltans virus TaxID=2024608 RepID=A0A2H4UUC9_9VIRU|nr:hypothetical protein QJ851_gp0480 [Bodo saltans virus]ATZ80543.1 hypothetical protein BMW23_0494 [Bodo saltans virus]
MPNLEPRLIEYLKKKKFNKNNGVDCDLLEREYSITKKDIESIKLFYNNRKINNNTGHSDYVNPNPKANGFQSITEQHDARLEKIKMKQQRDKEANDQRQNYDIISRGFDMYRNDRLFASANGNDFKSKFNPQNWLDSESEDDEIPNRNKAQVSYNDDCMAKTNMYQNIPPKIKYNAYTQYGNNTDLKDESKYSLNSIISNLDSYRENRQDKERTFLQKNFMDTDQKVVIPSLNDNNKRDKQCDYQAIPLMNGNLRNIDTENYLNYGTGQVRAKKSRGYPNPVEHYFSYISDDIQDPDHVVFNKWVDTRGDNKRVARPQTNINNRDIMM